MVEHLRAFLDPRLATPTDPEHYDDGAVLWQVHAGALWARFTTTLRRALAAALGVRRRGRRLPAARPAVLRQGCRVPAPRTRALPRRHPPRRPRWTHGPATGRLTQQVLRDTITAAARTASLTTARPDGSPLELGWGTQLNLRPITATATAQLEEGAGRSPTPPWPATSPSTPPSPPARSTGARARTGPVRDGEHIAHLDVTPHHRRMIETAWQLGDNARYESLNLRRWAHMLGFRGHFLTKSRAYSVTFTRDPRRTSDLAPPAAAGSPR